MESLAMEQLLLNFVSQRRLWSIYEENEAVSLKVRDKPGSAQNRRIQTDEIVHQNISNMAAAPAVNPEAFTAESVM